MKKTFILGLIAAALGFTACSSEDDLNVNDNNQKKGMVLRATVELPAESRATISDDWTFAFSKNDLVLVRNGEMSPNNHYMFTKGTGDFTCISAIETTSPVTWYAYFPQIYVYFNQQSGKKEDVANFYALSGTTISTTTGTDGLSITMEPQVAILVIDNQIGSIDINVKTGQNSWAHSLKAKTGEKGFELVTYEEKVSLLTTNTPGTYYIAVPAGVQLAVKDGDKVIRSTGTSGLTAGKYYNLTVAPTTGTAKRKGNIDVKWVQLWEGGPKFAEYNVGAKSATQNGGFYTWGGKFDNANGGFDDWRDDHNKKNVDSGNLTGTEDTATYLWGDNWRMPTQAEFQGLLDNCTVEWTDNYNGSGARGTIFTGCGAYASNSMLLPDGGYYEYDTDDGKVYCGGNGYYWTSTPAFNNEGYYLLTKKESNSLHHGWRNVYAFSIRAVLNENK